MLDGNHDVLARDGFGTPLQDSDIPVEHPLFLREEIKRNVIGEVVQILLIFQESETSSTEISYKKDITPISGDTVATSTMIIYPWVKI